MQHARCKCGKTESWSSMGFPACQVCTDCGSTLASHPDSHSEPIPHDFETKYDQNTGKPFKFCIRCGLKIISKEER